MPIELSNITFTEQGDFVGESGEEEILNNGFANTFAGNDLIVGNSENSYSDNSISSNENRISGVYNSGTLNDNSISSNENRISGVYNSGTLNTDDGDDLTYFSRHL